ncbi:MAG: family 16 glycosylhydrolase [Oscillospiraceae bacterium]|nr:family 16 glycosylhydrolase [Oscillospiraceae bacterium]
MKKRTLRRSAALISAAAIGLGALHLGAFAAVKTDVNSDGSADKQDVTALVAALLGGNMPQGSDVNGDGRVNAADLTILKHELLYPKQETGKEPRLPATMYSNFRSGDAGDFFASDGWCNGRPFDCYWTKDNAAIKNNLLELRVDAKDDKHNDIYGEDYETHERWYPNYSGGEFRTERYYSYGYYETSMKAIKNDGVVSSFFTYTGPSDVINGQKNPWDEIDIEILGKDTTKMQVNYYVNGEGGHEGMVDLGFDASEGYHTYGFDWQPDHITWYVDGKQVSWYDTKAGKQRDGYYKDKDGDLPKTASKIMMNAWPGRGVDDWLKPFNGNLGLVASYEWVTYHKADNADDPHTLDELEEIAKQQGSHGDPDPGNNNGMNANATMVSNFSAGQAGDFFASAGWTNGKPFDCYWDKQNAAIRNNLLELSIDVNRDRSITADIYENGVKTGTWYPGYSGGEFRTNNFYHYGYYETSMKAIKNDGVVSSFFTYTGPSDVVNGQKNPWDEIDIEILGKDTTKVQLNYYRNGTGGHEKMIDLGFDSSEDFHRYGFDWQRDHITWYVDGKEVWTMWGDVPVTPSKIMMNAWPGRTVDDWLKPFNGRTGLTAYYQWVTYNQGGR